MIIQGHFFLFLLKKMWVLTTYVFMKTLRKYYETFIIKYSSLTSLLCPCRLYKKGKQVFCDRAIAKLSMGHSKNI